MPLPPHHCPATCLQEAINLLGLAERGYKCRGERAGWRTPEGSALLTISSLARQARLSAEAAAERSTQPPAEAPAEDSLIRPMNIESLTHHLLAD